MGLACSFALECPNAAVQISLVHASAHIFWTVLPQPKSPSHPLYVGQAKEELRVFVRFPQEMLERAFFWKCSS